MADQEPLILFVNPTDERVTFSISAHPNTTFHQLKEMIWEKTGVAVIRQTILPRDGDMVWHDSSTIHDAGFRFMHEVRLRVSPTPPGSTINITISLPPGYGEFELTVEDKMNVRYLKELICQTVNLNNHRSSELIIPGSIKLFRLFTEMQDDDTLYKYLVNDQSKVTVLFN